MILAFYFMKMKKILNVYIEFIFIFILNFVKINFNFIIILDDILNDKESQHNNDLIRNNFMNESIDFERNDR